MGEPPRRAYARRQLREAAPPRLEAGPAGPIRELLYLQRTAGNAAVAQHLAALSASSPPSVLPRRADIVVQRVKRTQTDKAYIARLKGPKNAKQAKKRIKEFGTQDGARWASITTWPRGQEVPEEEKVPFLSDVYGKLSDGASLDDLVELRRRFDLKQSEGRTQHGTEVVPSGTREGKLVQQGAIRIVNFDPREIKLKPVGPPKQNPSQVNIPPTSGGRIGNVLEGVKSPSKSPQGVVDRPIVPSRGPTFEQPPGRRPLPPIPTPQLGPEVFDQVADLLSLDLDAMWETWRTSLQPDFEGYVADHIVLYPYDAKVGYLALKNEMDPWEAEEANVPGDPEKVNLAEIAEKNDPLVEDLSRYLTKRYGGSIGLAEAFQAWKNSQLLYRAFAWSAAKHGGGPENKPPSRGKQDFIWLKQGGSVAARVYLNTAGTATEVVANELHTGWGGQEGLPSGAYQGLKYFGTGGAADRRDAIVVYVTDLDAVLSAIGRYQAANRLDRFVDERVLFSRPGAAQGHALRGVGVTDHPPGKASFSQLASGAVEKALKGANGSPDEFKRLLAPALMEAGLDPSDPSQLLRK